MLSEPAVPIAPRLSAPRRAWNVAVYGLRGFRFVWIENRALACALAALSLLTGALPAVIAYLVKLIVDAVALALNGALPSARGGILTLLLFELAAVVTLLALQRALSVCDALLRVRLAQSIIEQVLRKAQQLELADFENAGLQDELRLLTDQAAERPLSLVRRALIAAQQSVTLAGLLLLLAATLPALWVELRLNADAFRLFRAQSPDARKQRYLELLLTRETYAKELQAAEMGPVLLRRHRAIFDRLFKQDRGLVFRRAGWGFALGLVAAAALSGCYLWATWSALERSLSLGALAMLFVVLRQAQTSSSDLVSVLAGMHEDQLYVASLEDFLARDVARAEGGETSGPQPGSGIRFEGVSFVYPGSARAALSDLDLHFPAGSRISVIGKNGAGKTTLLKLLAGLYRPSRGRITLDGLDLERWQRAALRARLSVMFQDFGRYQLLAGENVGIGAADSFEDRERWQQAARLAGVDALVTGLPNGYDTQLGQWFEGGRELSAGEWQRVALARVFTRPRADIFILDEPTANLDRESEQRILGELSTHAAGKLAILVSHRATWSDPESLLVLLDAGRLVAVGKRGELSGDPAPHVALLGEAPPVTP